jgi:hypothetical protein
MPAGRAMRSLEHVVQKLQSLSPQRISEVEDFIDFLRQRDTEIALTQAAGRVAEPSFKTVWDNEEDAEYDKL